MIVGGLKLQEAIKAAELHEQTMGQLCVVSYSVSDCAVEMRTLEEIQAELEQVKVAFTTNWGIFELAEARGLTELAAEAEAKMAEGACIIQRLLTNLQC